MQTPPFTSQRIAHGLWLVSATTSAIMVFTAFVTPSVRAIVAQISAPLVTDGRMVRVEDKIEGLALTVNSNSGDIKAIMSRQASLESKIDAEETMIKFGGSLILTCTALGTYFTRRRTESPLVLSK